MKVFSLLLTSNDNCDDKTQALPVNTYCNHKKDVFYFYTIPSAFRMLLAAPNLLTLSSNIKSHLLIEIKFFYKYFSMYDKISHFHASDDEY